MLEDVLQRNLNTLLTPTARLSRHIRREFDRQQRQSKKSVWESLDVLPLNGWLERTWQDIAYRDPTETLILLEASQEEALWEEAIRSTRRDDPLLNVHQTALMAARAWDFVHRWEIAPKAADFERAEDTEAFFAWATKLRDQLRKNGWITRSELATAMTERISKGDFGNSQSFEQAGFVDPAPAESRLLRALKAIEAPQPLVNNARLRRFHLRDQAAEWTQAAIWAREHITANPSVSVGVAIPALRASATVVERIFDDVLHPAYSLLPSTEKRAFGLSIGRRLSETPLIASALLLLGLLENIPLAETLILLRSPFIPATLMDRLRLDAELRRSGIDKVSIHLASVRSVFQDLGRAADKAPPKQSPIRWSATFSNLLKAAGWGNGEKLADEEHAALSDWKDLLSQFARLGTVLPSLTLHQALEQLRHLASNTFLATPDEDAPIRIMDLQDLSGLRFDALWISGLDASTWPHPVQLNPFLPAELQRKLSMPRSSPESEFLRAQRLQMEWEHSADEVVFSSAAQAREEPLLVSPFIEHILHSEPVEYPGLEKKIFASSPPMESIPVTSAPTLARNSVHQGGVKILENQAACPFKAFATHRLSAQEMRETPFGISRMERGSAAHEALHEFWDQLKTKDALLACDAEQLEALMDGAIGHALDKQLARRHQSTGIEQFRRLEAARLKRLLKEWLKKERGRPDFSVTQTEVKEEVSIGGMALNVRADRIDRFDNGTHAIIDYKTGNGIQKKSVWEGPRMDQPQLPLYAVTHEDLRISQIAFGKIASDDIDLIPLDCDAKRLSRWRVELEALADQYLSGHAAVDPKDQEKTCALCRLGPLCRIADTTAIAQGEADE